MPPAIAVEWVPGTSDAKLKWPNRTEDVVLRRVAGYDALLRPGRTHATRSPSYRGDLFAPAAVVSYLDEGVDHYSGGPQDSPMGDVQVIGDASANHYWIVRGRSGESGIGIRTGSGSSITIVRQDSE